MQMLTVLLIQQLMGKAQLELMMAQQHMPPNKEPTKIMRTMQIAKVK